MSPLEIVLGILVFALVTAILYVWGMRKSATSREDMTRMLQNKCAGIILRQMRRQGELTEADMARLIAGVRAGAPWSRQKAVVGNAEKFAHTVATFLLEQRYIEQTERGYRLRPKSR